MLQLLILLPLRARNICELQREQNLYQDDEGLWHLEFKGAELKTQMRHGRLNRLHLPLSTYAPGFIPLLEEFLHTHRPKLPNADHLPHLFITLRGRPWTRNSLHKALPIAVLMVTGKRFYPHLIRTIWASEYISKTGNFATAAYMLNDHEETVMGRYYESIEVQHQANAQAFIRSLDPMTST